MSKTVLPDCDATERAWILPGNSFLLFNEGSYDSPLGTVNGNRNGALHDTGKLQGRPPRKLLLYQQLLSLYTMARNLLPKD